MAKAWVAETPASTKKETVPGYYKNLGYGGSAGMMGIEAGKQWMPSTTKTVTVPGTKGYWTGEDDPLPRGGEGFGAGGYQSGFQFQMPGLPQEPQVSQDMIRQWQERAKQEAGMVYDPQVLAIQQELDKAILAASQSAGNIPGYYEDILAQIKEWQKTETGAMQQRYFARGLGRGGGLIQEEGKLAETAGKQMVTAETEKARKLTDIDAQKQLLTEQAGAKTTGAETARGQYMASRSADLEDSYRQQKATLEQQKFQNQMAIQQFGLSAETQNFQNYLASTELAMDIWHNNQQAALEQESLKIANITKLGDGDGDDAGKPKPVVTPRIPISSWTPGNLPASMFINSKAWNPQTNTTKVNPWD